MGRLAVPLRKTGTMEKSKRELKEEIEAARRFFISNGRRVQKLGSVDENAVTNAKPRKQRLKMFS